MVHMTAADRHLSMAIEKGLSMSYSEYQIVTDRAAISRILLYGSGVFDLFYGAGLSAEAGVPTANQICNDIAKTQLRINQIKGNPDLKSPACERWLIEKLAWDRPDEKYAKSIRFQYPAAAARAEFFRQTLAGIRPSFAHHGAAILMSAKIIGRTCFTTNFDKLLETAFVNQGTHECQAIRTPNELQYWRSDPERCFCMKLHGDYDTHNTLNTSEETVRFEDSLRDHGYDRLRNRGLVVIGLAGYEKSVYSFFEELTSDQHLSKGVLDKGLLWGIHIGPKPLESLDSDEICERVHQAIESGNVGPEIKKLMARRGGRDSPFSFFPIFGAGQFFMDLIETTNTTGLIGRAEPLLDHEMRLRRVFRSANLSPSRVEQHIRNLKSTQMSSFNTEGNPGYVERAFELKALDKEVWFAYGDISERSYLGHKRFSEGIRAVVSSDDTFLSVGGGVAVAIARKAGMRSLLHEVSKFVPVPHGESRVTSAGDLPVHYVFHAATIEVTETDYVVTEEDVRQTFRDILRQSVSLGVCTLSVPLLGAGVAGLSPEESFRGLLRGYKDLLGESVPKTVVFVAFREAQLARAFAREEIGKLLNVSGTWSNEPWSSLTLN